MKMIQNTSGSWVNSSQIGCHDNLSRWEEQTELMYTYFYLLLFFPGLLLNTTALWVLCRHISKKTKAVIFMINLSFADLAHILSLPLRIYYYFTHHWPFGRGVCLFCFYLKYLNMYAAIMFLVCISVQRCVFLLKPFSARRWRRRYDLLISVVVWIVVGLGCSPFILMRSSDSSDSQSGNPQPAVSAPTPFKVTAAPSVVADNQTEGCFKDLPMRHVSLSVAVMMISLGELFGFLMPLLCIGYCSFRIVHSLTQEQKSQDDPGSTRNRVHSFTSSVDGKYEEKQAKDEKRRALRMVLSCTGLFLFCFTPYHVNFLLYLLMSQDILTDCGTRLAVRKFHPISLCIAGLSCCLNPILYYFLTAEFRMHFTQRTTSFSESFLSSPLGSPRYKPARYKPKRMDSTGSRC
ncbi:putative P2Y purinoceptor 10 [Eucyclogobius newberryi]|uniref:putative P2Y purinoceptor 10 n=1 Tax=Eucyclogobius newberryi TaxID=166745 RepID=UPI003B59F381